MNKTYEIKDILQSAISEEEKEIADKSIGLALKAGASAVQVTLDKVKTEIYALLDGDIDNIRQTGDRAMSFNIYAGGKYGSFSTNRLELDSLEIFLKKAVQNVLMLASDPCRKLPNPKDTAKDAIRGDETGLCWYGYDSVPPEDKLEMAKRVSVFEEFSKDDPARGWKLVSEEVEYNNTLTDIYLINSDGLHCRRLETSFEVCSQVTIVNSKGNKYSDMWWDYGISPEKVAESDCGHKAVELAARKINPVKTDSGLRTMVVSNKLSGRFLQPVLSALGGRPIQQKASFLMDSLGKQIFSKGLNIIDLPREKGKCGATFFESDGRACIDREIITDGVVKEYFIGTYMSEKLGMAATSECPIRPTVRPFISDRITCPENIEPDKLTEKEIIELCGNGILITDLNGGNCNSATGDFSYGVEGFLFENGKVTSPIRSMLITGNIVELWKNLDIAGADPKEGLSRQVPTLAFRNVNFSA